MATVTVYGFGFSPYVQKVCILCEEKGIDYESVPISPRGLPPELASKTPLGKIPFARVDDDRWLADSSVICQYLDAVHKATPLIPAEPWEAAQAAFYEEYVDAAAIPKIGPKTLFERLVKPRFLGQEPDEEVVREAVENELPQYLGWLDAELGGKAWLVGDKMSLADISLGCFLTLLANAEVSYDHSRFAHLSRYGNTLLARPSFQRFAEIAASQLPE